MELCQIIVQHDININQLTIIIFYWQCENQQFEFEIRFQLS